MPSYCCTFFLLILYYIIYIYHRFIIRKKIFCSANVYMVLKCYDFAFDHLYICLSVIIIIAYIVWLWRRIFFFYLLNNRHFFLSVHLMPMKWFNWRKGNVYFDSSVLEHYQVCGQEYFRSILFLYKVLHVQFFHWLVSLQLVEEIKSIHVSVFIKNVDIFFQWY